MYPLLRTVEKYLQKVDRSFQPVREQFAGLKDRVFEKFTGRAADFRADFELRRQRDVSTTFRRDLNFDRARDRDHEHDQER